MGDQEIKQLLDTLRESLDRMGLTPALGDFKDNIDDANTSLTRQDRLIKHLNESFDKVNKELFKGRRNILDMGSSIASLTDQMDELEDNVEKRNLQEKKELLESQYRSAVYKKAAKDFSIAIGDVLVKGALRSTKTLVNGLQNNASGISIAGGLMADAIETQQAGVNAVAKTAEGVGGSLAALGPKAGKFGIGLQIAGQAVSYFSGVVGDAAKFGIEMLTKEVEKTVKAFNDSTAAGALFAHGMDDVRFYASRSGLTIEQFANVIKTNSQELARSGLTVSGGAKAVANVTSRFAVQTGKSGQTLQREMLNLGIGFEEQANITAQVISDLKRTGSGKATNSEVAQATVNIAKNMKAVADIMGEEAKGRQDAAKKAAEQYAFQAKVREIAAKIEDPVKRAEYLKNIEISLAMKSGPERRSAMQEFVSGVTTDVGAILTGAAASGKAWSQVALSGESDLGKLTESTGKLNDKFQSSTNEVGRSISKVAMLTGELSEYSGAFDEQMQDSYKLDSKNIQKGLANADALSAAHGGLHEAVIGAEIEAQKLKKALQDELTPAISKFAVVADQILEGVRKKLADAGLGGSDPKEIDRDWSKILKGAALATAGVAGGIATSWTGIGGIAGGVAATTGAGMMMEGWQNKEQYAEGGIASGPISGFQAELHGIEAVVPLPDGKNIPVEVKQTNDSTKSEMTGILNEVRNGNQTNNANMQELIRAIQTNNSLTSGILQHSY